MPPLDAPKSCIITSAGPVLALFLLTPHFLTEPMRDKSGVFDPPLPGVASTEEEGIIGTIGGEDALSGVEGGNGGDEESRCSSMSSNTLLSMCGGRDFLRSRRRSRWGGEGGSIARDEAPERTRWDVELKCPIEFRPDVVGIEKTETAGERGKGSIGEGEKAGGRAGTGGGEWIELVCEWEFEEPPRSMGAVFERAVTVLSSSLSSENPKPASSSSSEVSAYASRRVRFITGVLSLSSLLGDVELDGSIGSSKSSSQFSGSADGFGRGGV